MTDVAVQTESATVDDPNFPYGQTKTAMSDEQESTLSASDLASILKWSKDISSDINLFSGLTTLVVHGRVVWHIYSVTKVDRDCDRYVFLKRDCDNWLTFDIKETSGSQNTCGRQSIWPFEGLLTSLSGYHTRRRRLYCSDEHDTTRTVPSIRVRSTMVFRHLA